MNYIMLYYTQLIINQIFNYNKYSYISNNGDIETGFEPYIFTDLDNHNNNNMSNYLFKIIINK
jgi:hypothetical protein